MTKEEKNIKTHIDQLVTEKMRDKAGCDKTHDIHFQVFRLINGYREALDKIDNLEKERQDFLDSLQISTELLFDKSEIVDKLKKQLSSYKTEIEARGETITQLEKDKAELIDILLSECRYLDNLGGDLMTLGQELKFTQYAGIIESKTGKSIEELLK